MKFLGHITVENMPYLGDFQKWQVFGIILTFLKVSLGVQLEGSRSEQGICPHWMWCPWVRGRCGLDSL